MAVFCRSPPHGSDYDTGPPLMNEMIADYDMRVPLSKNTSFGTVVEGNFHILLFLVIVVVRKCKMLVP